MASGAKMSYNHFQSGKYGGLPQSSPQKDIEVSQDMHLKMSKKIAQLTKVIYALNTKNDENESVLQTLRDQHEEEIQQILADTRQKIAIYKDRIDTESDQQATIQALQTRVAEHQADHSAIWEQFSQYKTEVATRQERERQDYASKLFDMSHDLLKAKKDFEEHMERFGSWKERITAEHTTAFSELKSKHERELEDLRSFQRNQDDTWLNQCAKIEEKFKDQIENLKTQVEEMQLEKVRLNEEYTIKLEKAQAFYEKELEALKNSKSQEHKNESEALRKEIDRLKSDFGANDRDMRVQIDRLVHQLADTEDALELSKTQQLELQAELAGRDSSSGELLKQLQDLKEQMASQSSSLHSVEAELAASKQHCTDLADELMKKSTLLGQLEAHNMQKDGVISSLRSELEKLKEKMTRIDAERTSLLSQNQSMSTEQKSQLLSLRQALEDMTVEKETQKQRFERNIQSLTEELARKEKELKEEMANKVAELEKNHADARDQDRKLAAEVLSSTKRGLMEKHESELGQEKLKQESIQAELEALRANLTDQLAAAQREIERLEKVVKESEDGYGTASGQLNNLKEVATQLRAELEKTRSELKASKTAAANLQAEIDKAKVLHEGKLAHMETEMQNRLHSLTEELDAKWKETMKVESGKLRQELTAQKEDEKRAALSQLSKLKDEEIAAVRAGLDAQFDHLKKQLEELQLKLEQAQSESQAERTKRETEIEQEKSNLNKCMLEAATEYSNKIATMEKMHAQEIERLVAHKDQEKMDLEGELQKRHLEEMKGQMAAHKAAMDNAGQLELRQRQAAMEELKKTQLEELKKLQGEFEEKKQLDIEELKQNHAAEIRAARMELDRAVEISRQKEKDHHIQLEDLRTEIGHRDQHIKNLQDQLVKLQNEIDKLKQEIQAKLMEIKQVQKQAGQQLKLQEDKLNRHNQQAMDNLTADHLRDQQEMLAQFGSAQEMLKDKISGLQIELQESQMRYEQRESRSEDLEMIESLRCEVSERENRIKDLIDEKRFYQLELVNRETNFNKVFNTTPNVGVLNPFAKPKKKGDKGPNLSMGGGSHQRLDPLPGSPMHDGKLNPSKPLPQPNFTKKFVK